MSRYQPYPKYKESGVEWLGEVPEKWKIIPLKYSILNFRTTPIPKKPTNSPSLDESRRRAYST
jgi:type I restriction enzyme S subunit